MAIYLHVILFAWILNCFARGVLAVRLLPRLFLLVEAFSWGFLIFLALCFSTVVLYVYFLPVFLVFPLCFIF